MRSGKATRWPRGCGSGLNKQMDGCGIMWCQKVCSVFVSRRDFLSGMLTSAVILDGSTKYVQPADVWKKVFKDKLWELYDKWAVGEEDKDIWQDLDSACPAFESYVDNISLARNHPRNDQKICQGLWNNQCMWWIWRWWTLSWEGWTDVGQRLWHHWQ